MIKLVREATEEVLREFRSTLEKINDGRSKTDTTITNYKHQMQAAEFDA